MVNPTCSQNYTKNQNAAGWQLNAVPVRKVTIDGDDYFEIYFPRPWIIVGLVNLLSTSLTDADLLGYGNSLSVPMSPAAHDTYKGIFPNVFLDLAFATTNEPPEEIGRLSCNYIAPGLQKINYRGKFTKILSSNALNTPAQQYNSLIQPESLVQQFCANGAALTEEQWAYRFQDLVQFIKNNIDQELMGAPGIYRYWIGNAPAAPNWDAQTDYQKFENF